MRQRSLALSGFLLLLTCHSGAQTQYDTCKTTIVAKASVLKKVDKVAASLRGSKEFVQKFREIGAKAAAVRWTCSRDNEDPCCKKIPLTVLTDDAGTVCAVSFPYGELYLKRDHGSFKPWVTWELQQAVISPPAYEFGSAGIEVTKRGSKPLAVETSSADRCRYAPGGRRDAFRCKGNGLKNGEADHIANVYPAANIDEPMYRCGNVDPTIFNVD